VSIGENHTIDFRESACKNLRLVPSEAATQSIEIRLGGRKHSVPYQPGDTVLEAARRLGLRPPFNCQAGNCGTCMAFVEVGEVAMRENNVLDAGEVAEGWVLTCQAVPLSPEVVVDYDR
jgi:ferredoxin